MGTGPSGGVHESSRIARISFGFVKFVLIRGQQVVGELRLLEEGRAAKEKRNPFRFERKRKSSSVEAVRKPLLLSHSAGRIGVSPKSFLRLTRAARIVV